MLGHLPQQVELEGAVIQLPYALAICIAES